MKKIDIRSLLIGTLATILVMVTIGAAGKKVIPLIKGTNIPLLEIDPRSGTPVNKGGLGGMSIDPVTGLPIGIGKPILEIGRYQQQSKSGIRPETMLDTVTGTLYFQDGDTRELDEKWLKWYSLK